MRAPPCLCTPQFYRGLWSCFCDCRFLPFPCCYVAGFCSCSIFLRSIRAASYFLHSSFASLVSERKSKVTSARPHVRHSTCPSNSASVLFQLKTLCTCRLVSLVKAQRRLLFVTDQFHRAIQPFRCKCRPHAVVLQPVFGRMDDDSSAFFLAAAQVREPFVAGLRVTAVFLFRDCC